MKRKPDQILRKNLKRLRLLMGVSQDDMGTISGLSQKTISNLERENSTITPQLKTIIKVAGYFGIHPGMLLMEDLTDDSLTDKEVSVMLERFTQLQPKHKSRIMDLINDYWTLETEKEHAQQ